MSLYRNTFHHKLEAFMSKLETLENLEVPSLDLGEKE